MGKTRSVFNSNTILMLMWHHFIHSSESQECKNVVQLILAQLSCHRMVLRISFYKHRIVIIYLRLSKIRNAVLPFFKNPMTAGAIHLE